MAQKQGDWIWRDGEWIAWKDATVHLSAHALHYGSAVFEGIRAYATDDGETSIFRLDEHLERLHASARLLRFDLAAWPVAALSDACRELVRRNQHGACYLRPLAFRDAGSLGVDGRSCPVSVALISFEWGAYLGEEGMKNGIDVAVSSWRRMAPGTVPAGVAEIRAVADQERRLRGPQQMTKDPARREECECTVRGEHRQRGRLRQEPVDVNPAQDVKAERHQQHGQSHQSRAGLPQTQ